MSIRTIREAAERQDEEALKRLLSQEICIDEIDIENGPSAAARFAFENNKESAEFLRRFGANINRIAQGAAAGGHCDYAEFLRQEGADIKWIAQGAFHARFVHYYLFLCCISTEPLFPPQLPQNLEPLSVDPDVLIHIMSLIDEKDLSTALERVKKDTRLDLKLGKEATNEAIITEAKRIKDYFRAVPRVASSLVNLHSSVVKAAQQVLMALHKEQGTEDAQKFKISESVSELAGKDEKPGLLSAYSSLNIMTSEGASEESKQRETLSSATALAWKRLINLHDSRKTTAVEAEVTPILSPIKAAQQALLALRKEEKTEDARSRNISEFVYNLENALTTYGETSENASEEQEQQKTLCWETSLAWNELAQLHASRKAAAELASSSSFDCAVESRRFLNSVSFIVALKALNNEVHGESIPKKIVNLIAQYVLFDVAGIDDATISNELAKRSQEQWVLVEEGSESSLSSTL